MDEQRTLAEARRSAATRAIIKYSLLGFFAVAIISTMLVYAVYENGQRDAARRDRIAENNAVRMELCTELEKLKSQNREDIADEKKNYRRNLRLLHIQDTPELHAVAEAGWAKALRRNAAKPCPYTGHATKN